MDYNKHILHISHNTLTAPVIQFFMNYVTRRSQTQCEKYIEKWPQHLFLSLRVLNGTFIIDFPTARIRKTLSSLYQLINGFY